MTNHCTPGTLIAAVFALAGCLFAQPSAAGQTSNPAPDSTGVVTLTATTRTVLLDVVATDRSGHPIRGLKPADFTVLEDGAPQSVVSFELHDAQSSAERAQAVALARHASELPPNTFANEVKLQPSDGSTVILLDLLDTPVPAQQYARNQLMKYLKTMQPGTPIAIFELDTSLHLLQGFTPEPAVLLQAVQDREKIGQTAIPIVNSPVAGRIRMDVLTQAMHDLGDFLKPLPGRKNLVWFTARIPRTTYDDGTVIGGSLHDSMSFDFDYASTTELMRLGRVAIYPIDVRGLETDPAFSAANRGVPSNRTTQQFATRQFFDHSDLDEVAIETGGKAFYNTNGIAEAIARVVETGSCYYTLSYNPSNRNWDGKYRKVKLVLNNTDGTLEYRQGYYAVSDKALPAHGKRPPAAGQRVQITRHDPPPGMKPFVKSMQLGGVDPSSIHFEVHVAAAQQVEKPKGGAPAVKDNSLDAKHLQMPYRVYTVGFKVLGNQLNFAPTANGRQYGKVEFVALLFDDQGVLVNSTTASTEMELLPATYDRVLAAGVQIPVQLQVPAKGTYFFRFGIHDMTNDKAGTLEVAAGRVQLGTN